MEYVRRFVDDQLDKMMSVLPAIALEGAKGVGKTATALQRTNDVFTLDDEGTQQIIAGNPSLVTQGRDTAFIDEWQNVPSVWNAIRHAVDEGASPRSFLLAGSASPKPDARIHSGAGRIVRLFMRPLSLPERGLEQTTVSLRELLIGDSPPVEGSTSLTAFDYIQEILGSGFPGIRSALPDARTYLLQSYVDRIVDRDVDEMGQRSRRSALIRAWLTAYAAATSTTASYSSLLDAATPGQPVKPTKVTAIVYRDLLQRLWILDPLPAWIPGFGHFERLAQSPKHHLIDPALAALLVGTTQASLVRGEGPPSQKQDGTFLTALFESLAVQTVRVLAETCGCTVAHFRTHGGDHEVDLIIQRPDQRIVAVEVKLSTTIHNKDVRNLNWLQANTSNTVLDKVILNTGTRAYRRFDKIAVIPLGLLGL